MKTTLSFLLILAFCSSCSNLQQVESASKRVGEYQEIIEEDYELSKPKNGGNMVLILFGGFSENTEKIKREFKFLETAKENNIAVLYMNYNRKLWMTETEKKELKKRVESIFISNNLSVKNVHIGGFSSGGNISLLLTEHLISTNSTIQPKGIFVVDSPVDLLELYKLSERNLARNYSEISKQESTWLINLFKEEFGTPDESIEKYENHSPFTYETKNISNLANLDGLKIRFYSEPDTKWWKENRNNDPTDLNAYWIEKLTIQLKKELANSSVEYIITKNKGYRANGERHPHSWSIINKVDLISWMLTK